MNRFLFPILLLSISLCAFSWSGGKKKKKAPRFTVSGVVMEKRSYCGGAAPSPEQLNPEPYALAGVKLYVRKGNTNTHTAEIVDTIVTGTDGSFSIQLPAGDYCIVEAWKKGKMVVPPNTEYDTWDPVCYATRYAQCDYSLSVKGKVTGVNILFSRSCPWSQPCNHYTGPLPPAAHPPRQEKPPHQE
jgi:hypothetical protein